MGSNLAFYRYAPFIQEYIYHKGWTQLRDVQVDACEAIMDTDKNVLIASGTASGKTEAAFFPMLSLLDKHPSYSIGIMYISPLKALINDQFTRLNELLEDCNIPVWPWHGDIPAGSKQRAIQNPRGVLQITPESLESLIMRQPETIKKLFKDLRFIVIDEIHILAGDDRGLQIQCLIKRIEDLTNNYPRRIGLSATLSNYELASDYINSGSNRGAAIIGLRKESKKLSLCVESFIIPSDEEGITKENNKYNNFIYNTSYGKKCIVFTNSRNDAEKVIMSLRNIAKERGDRDIFHVHHGNISEEYRAEAEEALKDPRNPAVVGATLTLELGIDIGDLDTIIQLGSPYTASSLVQRLGRSGRRSGKSSMLFLTKYYKQEDFDLWSIPWDLLRVVSILQLYIEGRWVEPLVDKQKPFSLCAHQTLSTIMSLGELRPNELAQRVLTLPAFKNKITQNEYRDLLRYMVANDYLMRLDNGNIITGMKGEAVANNYKFYAVFKDDESYTVMNGTTKVGNVQSVIGVGGVFILAGKSWRVESVDTISKTLYVSESHNNRLINFTGAGGNIHSEIIEKMRLILIDDERYRYLLDGAFELLTLSRNYLQDNKLLNRVLIENGINTYIMMIWTGTVESQTIGNLFKHGLRRELQIIDSGSMKIREQFIYFKSTLSKQELVAKFHNISIDITDPNNVITSDAPKPDKYDYMVPDSLLRTAYTYNNNNIAGAIKILRSIEEG